MDVGRAKEHSDVPDAWLVILSGTSLRSFARPTILIKFVNLTILQYNSKLLIL